MPSDPKEGGPARKAGDSDQIRTMLDVIELIRKGHLSGKFEVPETRPERQSRLGIEEAKSAHQLWKEKVILVATLLGLGVIAGTCLVVALRPGASEDKKWAMSIVASIVSVGVGYLGGRASKPD